MDAIDVLESDFLEMRHRVLDLAAALDRINRADAAGSVQRDPRMVMLYDAVGVLTDGKPDRAQRVQLAFSVPYDDHWRKKP